MLKTLMVGLTEKDLTAVLRTMQLRDFYYPTLFPLKENKTLSWKSLELAAGVHVAGDLVARGASLDPKTRDALARLQGDIPKIAIKRIMTENELNEYEVELALTEGDSGGRNLVEYWANDAAFCYNGVAARLEWIALQSISRGKVVVDNSNNSSVITEYDMDYRLDADKKLGYQSGSSSWFGGTAAKPVTEDLRAAVRRGREKGINLKYAFMSPNTFGAMAQQEEVIKHTSSAVAMQLGVSDSPSLETVNRMLGTKEYLHGLQIVLVDQTVEVNGRVENPFVDGSVMLSEGKVLGNTFWKMPADMRLQGSVAVKSMQGHTCVKKFSTEEPIQEVTEGIANAIPAWTTSQRCYLMDVTHDSWQIG